MSTKDYTRTIGTVAGSGQVHLAHGISEQHILCRFGRAKRATTRTIAEIPENADICDVLLAAEVKVSKLCKQCFCIRTRKRYSAHIKLAIAEATDAELAAAIERNSRPATMVKLVCGCAAILDGVWTAGNRVDCEECGPSSVESTVETAIVG